MPTVGDVSLALINMGISISSLDPYMRSEKHAPIPLPPQQTQQRQLNLLQAGSKSSHPHYVPSYFPSMPDPHAYIRTPTHKQPVTEYEAIREKAACQKRDIEKALTKFLCKTSETNNLFPTEDNMFPCKCSHVCRSIHVTLIFISICSNCLQARFSTLCCRLESHRSGVRLRGTGVPLLGRQSN